MDGEFEGKVVLITGGGSEIGSAAATAFAQEGAIVVLAGMAGKSSEKVIASIREICEEANFIRTDVAVEREVEALVEKISSDYGRLDFAFNNAGAMCPIAPFVDQTSGDLEKLIQADLKGVFFCMKQELRMMAGQGHGAIVNAAALAGLHSSPGTAPYGAVKHAVMGLTRSAAVEYASKGVRVNAVCPGIVQTGELDRRMGKVAGWSHEDLKNWTMKQIPMGRFATAAEVAEAVLWLCSKSSSYVTGQGLVLDGGLSLR
jgi:NAD(P)-dependent dehydrogenase (short-subunit alcohol dehydrogenase family)